MKTFQQLRNEAKQHDAYWIDRTVLSFLVQLSSRMKADGLNKTQLAERIGTSKAYLSKIFSGNPNFTVATLVRLARATGAQVEIRIVPAQAPATTASVTQASATAPTHFVCAAASANVRRWSRMGGQSADSTSASVLAECA